MLLCWFGRRNECPPALLETLTVKLSLPIPSADAEDVRAADPREKVPAALADRPAALGHAGRLTSGNQVPMPVAKNNHQPVGSEYLLLCEAQGITINRGTWRFTLETIDGTQVLDADDEDLGDLNRLTLLAAVRGLEAIEGSSSVMLLSNNRYLIRSLSDSLPRWRQNNFVWDHFGRRIDVQHAELWRRVDRALSIHRVEACLVSTRLVSTGETNVGMTNGETATDSGKVMNRRIDGAHDHKNPAGLKGPHFATPRRKGGDRLRRLLMGGAANGAVPVPALDSSRPDRRRRFTSADLQSPS